MASLGQGTLAMWCLHVVIRWLVVGNACSLVVARVSFLSFALPTPAFMTGSAKGHFTMPRVKRTVAPLAARALKEHAQ